MKNKYKKVTVIMRTALLALSIVFMVSCNDDVQIEEFQTETELNVEELPETSTDNQTNRANWGTVIPFDGEYRITNYRSLKRLVVGSVTGSQSGGENVYQHQYGLDDWYLERLDNGYFKIGLVGTDRVLDVVEKKTGNGANIQVWNGGNGTNQQWTIQLLSDNDNTNRNIYRFINRNSNKVMGVQGAKTGSGANVIQWQRNNNTDHQWTLLKQD